MAISNVRFYKLNVLPPFEAKHKGIFVHVAETMHNYRWTPTNHPKEVDPATLLITTAVKEEDKIYLSTWLSKRHITEIESGLWFGGENGWELLSNETNSAAIDAAIVAKINALNAGGFTQATIGANTTEGSESATGSTLTILGIKETKGKIEQDNTKNVNIAIDGVYNETDNKIATKSTVTNAVTTAINGLDSEGIIQAVTFNTPVNGGNTTLTFNGVKEENGVITQGASEGAGTFIVGDAKLKIQIGSNEAGAFDVFSANAQSNGAIKLNENVFKKDENNVISVIALTDVASNNKLVTEQDIANLAGAMYYKGSIASDTGWPANENVKAGYVWIASGNFEHGNESIESGDLIVFNANNDNSKYTVVQSNITLGTGDGQIAANVGALSDGNLVVGVNSTTGKGIKTVDFDVTNLTDTTGKNERNLTLDSKLADRELQSEGVEGVQGLYHSVGITDTFTIMGRNMSKSFSISSRNRSISIEKVGDVNSPDAQIDLIWNTVMDA